MSNVQIEVNTEKKGKAKLEHQYSGSPISLNTSERNYLHVSFESSSQTDFIATVCATGGKVDKCVSGLLQGSKIIKGSVTLQDLPNGEYSFGVYSID